MPRAGRGARHENDKRRKDGRHGGSIGTLVTNEKRNRKEKEQRQTAALSSNSKRGDGLDRKEGKSPESVLESRSASGSSASGTQAVQRRA